MLSSCLQLGLREGEPRPWEDVTGSLGCSRAVPLLLAGTRCPAAGPHPTSPLSVTFSIPPAWLTYAQRNPYQVQTCFFTTHKPSCSHGGPGAGTCLPRWETAELLDGSIPAPTLCRNPTLGQAGWDGGWEDTAPRGLKLAHGHAGDEELSQQSFALQLLTITAPGCSHRGDVLLCPARNRRGLLEATTAATCIGWDFPSEVLLRQVFPTPRTAHTIQCSAAPRDLRPFQTCT